jgi:hypothetical protein
MKKNTVKIILLVAMSLLLVACSSSPDDVPSLEVTPTAVVEEQPLDDEAKVMAFVKCMHDEDMQLKDPVVDADGNVQPPEVVEGVTYTREEWAAPYAICGHYIEGISFGKESGDMKRTTRPDGCPGNLPERERLQSRRTHNRDHRTMADRFPRGI